MKKNNFHRAILAALGLCTVIVVIAFQNIIIDFFFPSLPRLTTDFSPMYLARELRAYARERGAAIFFGDSVLWGYRLESNDTALALLAREGCRCRNLAFKSGNPANDYLLSRLLLESHVNPGVVVLEINQAVLNQADSEYQTVHPAIWSLAHQYLTRRERLMLTPPVAADGRWANLERIASSVSLLYAMRSDLHAMLYGDVPPPPRLRITPELFEGTYDLSPLALSNVGVHFLVETAHALHQAGVPVLAFHTPVNHALLHSYIDNVQYRSNKTFLTHELLARGASVLDLDSAFPSNAFLDETHLTPGGQNRLARILAHALHHYSVQARVNLAR
ncbi:MAG: hypothetical protein DLM50_08790 [Candidatus Meridianibacter frigidus]|nr:MAG: hypothetical protein DLM50_08790 [Candidatus Eremiobacteraeota bacterium]